MWEKKKKKRKDKNYIYIFIISKSNNNYKCIYIKGYKYNKYTFFLSFSLMKLKWNKD